VIVPLSPDRVQRAPGGFRPARRPGAGG